MCTSDTPPLSTRLDEIKQQIEKAHGMVAMLCTGERDWLMSIPARPDHDPDIIIDTALRGATELTVLVESQAREIADLTARLSLVERDKHAMVEVGVKHGWHPVESQVSLWDYLDQHLSQGEADTKRLDFLTAVAHKNTSEEEQREVVEFERAYGDEYDDDDNPIEYMTWTVMGSPMPCGYQMGESDVGLREAIDKVMSPSQENA